MGLENLVQWTRSKLSQFTGGDVPVTTSSSLDALTSSGRVALPLFDLFESNAISFDEFALYDQALTPARIGAHYAAAGGGV